MPSASGRISGISVHTEIQRQSTHQDGMVETTVLDADIDGSRLRAAPPAPRMSYVTNNVDSDLTPMVYEVRRLEMIGSIIISDVSDWRSLP